MKRRGCILAVGGSLLFVGALVFLVVYFLCSLGRRPLLELPLAVGSESETGPISLDAGHTHQVGLSMTVVLTAGGVTQERGPDGEEQFMPRYRIPVTYVVRTATGREIQRERLVCEPDTGEGGWAGTFGPDGGTIRARHRLPDIRPFAEGEVEIAAELSPDEVAGAQIADARLTIYTVSAWRALLPLALVSLAMSPVLAFIGVVTYLCGLTND